jgi:hypothetical protein
MKTDEVDFIIILYKNDLKQGGHTLFYFSKPVSLSKISILPASEKFFVKLKK